jgi:FkbM family methyltransferase
MPSHPGKLKVQDFLGKICFPKGIRISGKKGLRFSLSANDWMTRIILLHKGYEMESLNLANKILKDGGTFIDVGANFGLYSCNIVFNNPNVKAIAIEPNYMVVSKLIQNINLNNLSDKISVVNTAVSRSQQLLKLELSNVYNLGTAHFKSGSNGWLNVASYPLEYILQSYHLKTIDLIKIDIEGMEMEVLEDFPFDKFEVKNIILEFNSLSRVDFNTLKEFFNRKNFNLFNVRGKEILQPDDIIEDNVWLRNRNYI